MIRTVTLLIFSIVAVHLCGQEHIRVFRDKSDTTFNSYYLILPESGTPAGMIIRDYSKLPPKGKKSRYKWMDLAIQENLAVLITCTSNYFPELYYHDDPIELLDEIVNEVVSKYSIPKQNLFVGGISASGTRALQYEKYLQKGLSKFNTELVGVFIVDSPLDFERFYESAKDIKKRNHPKGMNQEAEWMIRIFPEKFGEYEKNKETYRLQSVFSHQLQDGGNATYFKSTPILAFHEPDMEWWLNERNAVYTDINSFDIVGFERALKNLGNKDVTVIATREKGFDKAGNRNCHSWTIVDEPLLIAWIKERIRN